MTDASKRMNEAIRRRLGRTEPDPEQPASPNGKGDGGATGEVAHNAVAGSELMDDLVRGTLDRWRREGRRRRR